MIEHNFVKIKRNIKKNSQS